MTVVVQLTVTFTCDHYVGIRELAARHLPAIRIEAARHRCPEAVAFLEELTTRRGNPASGPQIGVAAWTSGGNKTDPQLFADVLRPFWDELLRHPVTGGPVRMDHVVILFQTEDAEWTSAIEIYLDVPDRYEDADLVRLETWPLILASHPELPFRW